MNKLTTGCFAACMALVSFAGCSNKAEEEPAKPQVESPAPPQAPVVEKKGKSSGAPASEVAAAPSGDADKVVSDKEALALAKQGAMKLGKTLKESLVIAMQKGGPETALHACAQDAQRISGAVGNARLRVGRSTLRLRNPKNEEAPGWVKEWLKKTGERKAEGVAGVAEVVDGTAHFLKPLALGGLCLSCHGESKNQTKKMQEILANRYPEDKALGYEVGDLRGVIWAEYDVTPKAN